MTNTGFKTLRISLVLLLFLSLMLISQDPPKKQKQDTVVNRVERPADSLYIQQMKLNAKLDSLVQEKSKK
jgi:hypothetical protein